MPVRKQQRHQLRPQFKRFLSSVRANAIVISSETLKMMFWRLSKAEKTQGLEHGCCTDTLAYCDN